ncbi:Ldh family oxidoreductase [Thalassobaculum sp.]|uniref:Ldh family oxidoreductase n=1 Tax=Thalassobaculum sp. TaxID=2022740 RepID=UPI0032EAEE96
MARYPGEESERRFPHRVLRDTVGRLFAACGMNADDAGTLADSLAHADLRGIHSHGVLRVPDYVQKLTSDGVDPAGRPRVVSDIGGALVVDADNAMGQIAGRLAIDRAIARASRINVAFVAVRGSNHSGALDWYTLRAAEHDMIGIAGTNALPTMAPPGGTEKLVGLNPVSVAIPGGETGPLVLDVALGATAHGKIRVYAQKRQPIPEGWALDAEGRPTTDAAAALEGLIQPIGGHKGTGLAMMVGILASVLSGAGYGTESGNMADGAVPGADGQFYMALNVAGFREIGAFKAHVDRLVRQYRGSRRADGVERLYLPGEIEAELEARNRRDGVPLNDGTVALIAAAGEQLGVDVSALLAAAR